MKLLKLLLFLSFFATYSNAHAQDSLLVWQVNKPLQWSDFTGPIDTTSTFQANSFTSERYSYNWHRQDGVYTITFKVHGYLHKKRSWTIVNKQTDYLLAHEQLHFDICELYARKMLAAFKAETYDANFKERIIQICNEVDAEKLAVEKKYDDDSNHSRNKIKQQEWALYIKQLLEITPPSD